MNGFEVTESQRLDELTYHRIVETMKHAYAIRTGLTDPNFYGEEVAELVAKSSNETFLQLIRNNITAR
jgi:gamma-glutamyltranspeptidase/glutathione hydrolase/leukotriene-C4 hydrolase